MTQHFKDIQIFREEPLGCGSYGAVYKAKCDELPCAAKILHSTIIDPKDAGSERVVGKFTQECLLQSTISHPNVVMYLGVCMKDKQQILLMELLDESLTHMLESSTEALPYHVQIDFSQDVAFALSFLHARDIVHRDLSSNNVLVLAGKRAKVTDFGMAKIIPEKVREMTLCPGTVSYMSPEALEDQTRYNEKLDCFSLGVLMIQICTRLFPDPGPRCKTSPDSRSEVGEVKVPIPDYERRKDHLSLIEETNPLRSLAIRCISYSEKSRPSAQEVSKALSEVKEKDKYKKNKVEQEEIKSIRASSQESLKHVKELESQLKAYEKGLEDHGEEIKSKDEEIDRLQTELQDRESSLREQEIQIGKDKDQILELQMKSDEQELRIYEQLQQIHEKNQKLRESESLVKDTVQALQEKDQISRKNERLVKDMSEKLGEKTQVLEQLQILDRQIQDNQALLSVKDITIAKLREEVRNKEEEEKKMIQKHEQELQQMEGKVRSQNATRIKRLSQMEEFSADLQASNIGKDDMIEALQSQVRELKRQLEQLQERLELTQHAQEGQQNWLMEQERDLETKGNTLKQQNNQLKEVKREILRQAQEISDKEHAIRFLEERERNLTTQLQEYKRTVSELRYSLEQQMENPRSLLQSSKHTRKTTSGADIGLKLKLGWKEAPKAPFPMIRGTAIADENAAFFNNFNSSQIYNCTTSKPYTWGDKVPECPVRLFSLAKVEGYLTTIGGITRHNESTNNLYCLVRTKDGACKWEKYLPSMITKRANAAVVLTGNNLIVIGGTAKVAGKESLEPLQVVEIFDTSTKKWKMGSRLLQGLTRATAVVCNEQLYVIGGEDHEGKARSVQVCSVPSLIQSTKSGGALPRKAVWRNVCELPVYDTTGVCAEGHVLAIGGSDQTEGKASRCVYRYDPVTNFWEPISSMGSARSQCLVGTLKDNELMVVGGANDSVEIANILYSC